MKMCVSLSIFLFFLLINFRNPSAENIRNFMKSLLFDFSSILECFQKKSVCDPDKL